MKSAAHGTYLKALPSDNSFVEQTRDENELGTEWRIERIGVDVTRSYFGDFRFGDFFFNRNMKICNRKLMKPEVDFTNKKVA